MLSVITPDNSSLQSVLGSSQERLNYIITEADKNARPFYKKLLGEDLGINDVLERIFSDVEERGDEAVRHWSTLFDGGCADNLVVGPNEMAQAWETCTPELQEALTLAVTNVRAYQEKLLPSDFGTDLASSLGARWLPVDRVGAYVPGGMGGTLPLCSTVIMNLVPAAVAGVQELSLTTPSRKDGSVAPEILAACHAAGINTVYKSGGMQAIAALSIGTESLPAVDSIVGPGNIFVTLAKKYAYGRVDLDMLAGPSEILVIADDSVDPQWIAADLLSQAEHDKLAMSILLAITPGVAEAVLDACHEQLAQLPDERREVAQASLEQFGCFVDCPDAASAIAIANKFAPEHLEVLTNNPKELIPQLRHAGAIFVGPYSPEPIGDYIAGPSHTLPTCGSARMWSGIGADIFLRRTSIINYNKDDFDAVAKQAVTLARAEGLEAHARSIEQRMK